jgi:hypothetical protein
VGGPARAGADRTGVGGRSGVRRLLGNGEARGRRRTRSGHGWDGLDARARGRGEDAAGGDRRRHVFLDLLPPLRTGCPGRGRCCGRSLGGDDSAPIVGGGAVIIGSPGQLAGLDMATGAELWRIPTPGTTWATPAVHDGILHVGELNGFQVAAVDVTTQEALWHHPIDAHVYAPPAVHAGTVVRHGLGKDWCTPSMPATERSAGRSRPTSTRQPRRSWPAGRSTSVARTPTRTPSTPTAVKSDGGARHSGASRTTRSWPAGSSSPAATWRCTPSTARAVRSCGTSPPAGSRATLVSAGTPGDRRSLRLRRPRRHPARARPFLSAASQLAHTSLLH